MTVSDAIIISPDDLVDMNAKAGGLAGEQARLRIDLVYAQATHRENIFGIALYRKEARLFLHRDLARLTLRAADDCYQRYGYIFVLKDGLRTIEAQAMMQETAIVKANPHWTQEPDRLLSPPGKGGHPRGMAIDIVLEDENGGSIEMGTNFDHLDTDPTRNPARRGFADISDEAKKNRLILEDCMVRAAASLDLPLLPLPAEWWDFRFPAEYSNRYAPLSDKDLPPAMRMTREERN